MPPKKSASRGGARRVTRAAARGSTQETPHSLNTDQSPPVNDGSAAITPPGTMAFPPQTPPITGSLGLIASLPGSGTSSYSNPPPKDADLDAPTISVQQPSNDVISDPASPSRNPDGLRNPNSGTDQEQELGKVATAVEASAKGVVNGGTGVKTKRVVKKTVKIVKKIVKKVPRKIIKGGPDSRIDESGVPVVNNEGTVPISCSTSNCLNSGVKEEEDKRNVTLSSNTETSPTDVSLSVEVEMLQQKLDLCEQKLDLCEQNFENTHSSEVQAQDEGASIEFNEKSDGLVGERNPENSGCGVSLSMEVEKLQDKLDRCDQNVENKQDLEVQVQGEGASMEADENVDGGVKLENSGTDVPLEALATSGDGEKGTEELEVKEDPSGASDAGGKEDKNEGKRVDEGQDGDNVATLEDEMGDGLYCSVEMEAMERRRRRKREIFLGGLDKDAKEEDIRKVFEEVGEVLDVRLIMNGNSGKNKGYAFLRYASAVDARKALEKFSAVEICGKQCGAVPLEGNDTIYLGGIDKKWKDEDIAKLLHDIGIEGVDNVLVMKDPENKERNRGYAFVEFETCRIAQVAFKKLQKKDILGKNSKMKVDWAGPLSEPNEAEMQKVKTVYAEYIPSTWDEEKVKEHFKKFGEIDNIVLARNLRNAKRKDYAFISYKIREAAIACIESFKHESQNDEGTKMNMKVSLARPVSIKQPKQVPKPITKEIPKERPKPKQGKVTVRRIDQRNNASNVISRHVGPRNNAASVISRQLDPRNNTASVFSRQFDPRNNAASVIMRQSIPYYGIHRPEVHQTVVHRDERYSTNPEVVHLLREQASWRPPHSGPLNVGHSTTFSGRKRPISTLDPDPVYSEMSGYPNQRFQGTFPSSSRYGAHPQHVTSAPSGYYQGQANYPSDLPYSGARNYLGNEPRGRAHGSSPLFRRY